MVDETLSNVGKVDEKYVKAKCPRCRKEFNQSAVLEVAQDEVFFAGYNLKCPYCGYEFLYKLY